MDAVHPRFLLRSLKTIRKGVCMLYTHGHKWRLLQVVVAVFLLNLVVIALLIASPTVNLDSIDLLYKTQDNSTARAAEAVAMAKNPAVEDEGTETTSPLEDLFWRLLMIFTVFEFSKVFRLEVTGKNSLIQGGDVTPGTRVQRIVGIFRLPPLTWREVKSLALVVFLGQVVPMFLMATATLLEAEEPEDYFEKFTDFFECLYLVAAVVISSEGIYGFDAIHKAWRLASGRYADIPVFVVTFILTQEALVFAYEKAFYQEGQQEEVAAAVIREDTSADILQFSLAAFLTVILQSFVSSVMLAFYNEITIEKQRRKAAAYEIKKIRRLARKFASMHATTETEVFKRELLKHTCTSLQHLGEGAMVQRASSTTSPSCARRKPGLLGGTTGAQYPMEITGQEGVRRGSRVRRPNRLYQSSEWDL